MVIDKSQVSLSYRPDLILWVNGGSADSATIPEYRRIKALARDGGIHLQEIHGDRLSTKDLERLFAVIKPSEGIARGSILLVAGLYLEDQVSRCCLQAIAEGYETFLLCDAAFPLEPNLEHHHLTRLTQAGVVPSSITQVAAFLIADEADAAMIERLRRHLKAGPHSS